ncbi:EthD domain-containing protein [Nocardia sp. NPDC005745]|uniref:EthD domain-containing protein n=1 Tax=Nocardia sp. NPDC005745 TaxID=3157061 RepID=UPI0033DF2114
MMKMLNFLTRRDGISREEFEDYWLNTHGPLVRKHAEALNLRRYIQVHARNAEVVAGMNDPRGGVGNELPVDYDGVVELWWDSAESFLESWQTEEGKAAWAAIAADEPNLTNRDRCYTYVGEEILLYPKGQ